MVKMNWKITVVFLILVILGLSIILYKQHIETYNFGEFEIKKNTVDEITKTVGNEFTVCNFEDRCIKFIKLE